MKADLSDLKAQFDWAEAHPVEARRIAEAGRAVEAETSTVEAYDAHYEVRVRVRVRVRMRVRVRVKVREG